ncbi:MAG: PilT/PilU family type 4a pilus ATPase [Acidimicrobiia bacterium]|nr:MAG: PilT/PilU family type 4a pilus ATPase [Acidimicrobiia bacterium]
MSFHQAAIESLLAEAVAAEASDLHLRAGSPPILRVDGDLRLLDRPPLTEIDVATYLGELIPDRLEVEFKQTNEADFAFSSQDGERFRINAFRQRGRLTVALRLLKRPTGDFDALGLPPVLERICAERRGLVLVTGPTGSGKSTTLSALVDRINGTRRVNIITIEDPIETVHDDKVGIVSQREVGVDTAGFGEAMRRAVRQDPDVILIGEMRDAETVDAALKAAETGHLVLSSLHTLDAAETVNRILDFFPSGLQQQVRLLLAGTLRAILSQRLLPRAEGTGRVPAVEVLINTERVAERIADPAATHEIPDVIADGAFYGMETFDQALLRLAASGVVTFDVALLHATKPADLRLRAQQLGLLGT